MSGGAFALNFIMLFINGIVGLCALAAMGSSPEPTIIKAMASLAGLCALGLVVNIASLTHD